MELSAGAAGSIFLYSSSMLKSAAGMSLSVIKAIGVLVECLFSKFVVVVIVESRLVVKSNIYRLLVTSCIGTRLSPSLYRSGTQYNFL